NQATKSVCKLTRRSPRMPPAQWSCSSSNRSVLTAFKLNCQSNTSTTICCKPTQRTPKITSSSSQQPNATACGSPKLATAYLTRSTKPDSVAPGPPWSARTPIRVPPEQSACWPSEPAGLKSPWQWPVIHSMYRCPKSGVSNSPANFPIGSQPKTSSLKCCAATALKVVSVGLSSTTVKGSKIFLPWTAT